MGNPDYISTHIAARQLDLSIRQVTRMFLKRLFPSAHKPGCGKNAHWKVLRTEIIKHKLKGHVSEQ